MARPRYPSDDDRLRVRPHVKVHLTVATHRRTAGVWADVEMRGMLVELWRIAAEAFAGRTGGVVELSSAAIRSITCAPNRYVGERQIAKLCELLEYTVHAQCACGPRAVGVRCERGSRAARTRILSGCNGGTLRVEIRNFQQKQGFNSATRGATPRTPLPSDSDSDSDSEKRREEAETAGAPDGPDEEAAARAKLERDVKKALPLLKGQEGDPEEKRLWLLRNLRAIEAFCREKKRPFDRGLFSFWGQYLGDGKRPFRAEAQKLRDREVFQEAKRRLGIRDGPIDEPDVDPTPVLKNNLFVL